MEGTVSISIKDYEEYKALKEQADDKVILVKGAALAGYNFHILPKDDLFKDIVELNGCLYDRFKEKERELQLYKKNKLNIFKFWK